MPERISPVTLSARGLYRNFGKRVAVEGVSLELKMGEVLGFLGPNGAGKTTTMQMLTGNLAASKGEIKICGIDLLENPLAAKRKLGYLPETPPLYRDLSVDGYLKFVAKLHRVKNLGEALLEAKERCGLEDVGGRLIGSLSKGYQQRVGIAQAIIHKPEVIILDEPTVGLDPNQIREIRRLIRELGDASSVILSTHILPEVESICDRVEILHRGRQVYGGEVGAIDEMGCVDVGLKAPPPIAELEGIEGVARLEVLSRNLFRMHHLPGFDLSENVIRLASERGWGLQQINPAKSSLEDIFSKLTLRDG